MSRILVIEDDAAIRDNVLLVLRAEGFEASFAANGQAGVAAAQTDHPDLIVCDITMPKMDGYEVLHTLRADPVTASIPFIFLTARADKPAMLTGINLGADDYITKPFDLDELLARIRAVLRRDALGQQKGRSAADEELQRLQQEISRNVRHELRTPLAIVQGALEVVLRERFSEDQSERERFIRQALESAEQVDELIEDLVALNQIDSGESPPFRQTIDLRHDFYEPVERCLWRWRRKEIKPALQAGPEIVVYAPRVRLRQAIRHLVDNACKFSPPGGQVMIHLAAVGSGGCCLTVSDQGPGIPPELQEKVFERYYQASQGDARQHRGMGVGLTIARSLARSLGGDVVILDSPQGCTVQMTISPGEADWIAR